MSRLIFLRHAETEKNPAVNAAGWNLSERGISSATSLTDLADLKDIKAIFSSEEPKAIQTTEPLAQKLGLPVMTMPAFSEVKRGDGFMTSEEFEKEKTLQLEDLSYPAFGGETGNDALARFKVGVAQVAEENPQKTILIVSHGTILNLYFADLLNKFHDLPARWKQTGFCAYGIVKNSIVVKDII